MQVLINLNLSYCHEITKFCGYTPFHGFEIFQSINLYKFEIKVTHKSKFSRITKTQCFALDHVKICINVAFYILISWKSGRSYILGVFLHRDVVRGKKLYLNLDSFSNVYELFKSVHRKYFLEVMHLQPLKFKTKNFGQGTDILSL